MPTYEYACSSCDTTHEVQQKMSDATLTECPVCGASGLRKLFTGVGIHFKGSGFYRTDSRDAKSSAGTSASGSSDSTSKGSTTDSGSKGTSTDSGSKGTSTDSGSKGTSTDSGSKGSPSKGSPSTGSSSPAPASKTS